MPHSEAVQELIAAADRARVILRVGGYKRSTSKCAATRLDHALEAVKAEEKPQTHRPAALPHYTDRDEIAENDGRTWGNK